MKDVTKTMYRHPSTTVLTRGHVLVHARVDIFQILSLFLLLFDQRLADKRLALFTLSDHGATTAKKAILPTKTLFHSTHSALFFAAAAPVLMRRNTLR